MAETVILGSIGAEDVAFGYGTYTQSVWGTPTTLSRINLSHLWSPFTVAFLATPIFDLQNGQLQTITLLGNVTASTIVNGASSVPVGARLILRIVQDGVGNRSFVFPTNLTNGATIAIGTAANAVTRVDLQYTGSAWEVTSLVGPGVNNRVPKFTGPIALGNSDLSESTSGDLRYGNVQSLTNSVWLFNDSNVATAITELRVGGSSGGDNIYVSLFSQKSGNPSNGWQLAGVLRAGAGSTNGLILSSTIGPIRFQPGGTTTKMALFPSTTGGSTNHNLEIGTTAATSTDEQPLYVERNWNGSTDIVSRNTQTSASARAAFRAIANGGGGNIDAYFGATSNDYNQVGIVGPYGFIYTGAGATNGFLFKTYAGPILFQIAQQGNSVTTASLSADQMQITGRFRAVGLTRSSPTSGTSIDLYCDNSAAGVLAAATWGSSEASSNMLAMNYAGSLHEWFQAATFAALGSRMRLSQGLQVGAPAGGDMGIGTVNAGGYYVQGARVVGPQRTGWTGWTGNATRSGAATSTATLTDVAEALKAVLDDLLAHGLIGA